MSIQNHYLILHCPKHVQPIGLIEYQKSIGSKKRRNLKWLKDKLHLSKSQNLSTDIQHLELFGYLSRVAELAKLPRNTHRNIVPEFAPTKVTTEELTKWFH